MRYDATPAARIACCVPATSALRCGAALTFSTISAATSGWSLRYWIVVDYVDVVVHVFSPEARAYYALERLWEKPAEKKEGDADAAS